MTRQNMKQNINCDNPVSEADENAAAFPQPLPDCQGDSNLIQFYLYSAKLQQMSSQGT